MWLGAVCPLRFTIYAALVHFIPNDEWTYVGVTIFTKRWFSHRFNHNQPLGMGSKLRQANSDTNRILYDDAPI